MQLIPSTDQGEFSIEIALPEQWPPMQDTLAYECLWQHGTLELYWLTLGSARLNALDDSKTPILTFTSPVISPDEDGYIHMETHPETPEIVLEVNRERVLSYTSNRR